MARGLHFFFDRLFLRSRLDREMDEELRSHLELRAADLAASGLSPREARRRSRLEFGSAENYKEQCRETRTFYLLHDFLSDLRYGFRMLRKSPGFAAVAVLTLALGIGATTAIFTVVSGVLLRPLPFPDPDRLVYISEQWPSGANPFVSSRLYVQWRDRIRTLSPIGAYIDGSMTLTDGPESERIHSAAVTASFFPLIGVQAVAGRTFTAEEDRSGGPLAVIVSHELAQRRLGGDGAAVGKVLTLGRKGYSVVGVLPAGFQIPDEYASEHTELWTPLPLDTPAATSKNFMVRPIGRLQPGATIETARAELDTILKSTLRKGQQKGVVLTGWHQQIAARFRFSLLLFLGAIAFVLLIACVNVANLMLSRAGQREQELAVRRALGASKARLMRQLLTESILLALMGAGLGLLFAFWGKDLLIAFVSKQLPTLPALPMDWRVLVFNLGVAVLAGVAFGLAPALQASRTPLNERIKEAGRSTSGTRGGARLRDSLVVFEVGLAMTLLIGAGLLFRSFLALRAVVTTPNPDRILTFSLMPSSTKYTDMKAKGMYFRQVLERIRGIPGVESAGATAELPLSSYGSGTVSVEGNAETEVQQNDTGPAYFETLGVPMLQGREFSAEDELNSAAVAIVNRAFARRFFADKNCIGRTIKRDERLNYCGPDGCTSVTLQPRLTIVGVVGDIPSSLDKGAEPTLYVPYWQSYLASMDFVARAAQPSRVAAGVRRAIAAVDSYEAPARIMTLAERQSERYLDSPRVNMLLLAAFSGLALVLGAIGIYGVISCAVTRRTHELGIRLALGARPADVLSLVVRRGLLLILGGEALGIALALLLNKVAARLVFHIASTDPFTYAGVAVVWLTLGLLASYLPARRGTKVDPAIALRCE